MADAEHLKCFVPGRVGSIPTRATQCVDDQLIVAIKHYSAGHNNLAHHASVVEWQTRWLQTPVLRRMGSSPIRGTQDALTVNALPL